MFAEIYSIFILLITWFRLIIALFQNKIPPKSTIGHAPPFGNFGPPTFKIASGCLDKALNHFSHFVLKSIGKTLSQPSFLSQLSRKMLFPVSNIGDDIPSASYMSYMLAIIPSKSLLVCSKDSLSILQ